MTAVAVVAKREKAAVIKQAILGKWAPQIQAVAHRGFTPEVLLAAYLQASVNDPALLECSEQSMYLALMKSARWGLSVGDGIYLVALKGKVEAWPSYQGLKALAMRQNIVRSMEEFVVYEGDDFDYRLGLDPYLHHKPCATAKRGAIVGAYSIITLRYGVRTFHYMPVADIEQVRKSSRTWGPPKPLTDWYSMKTVVRDWLARQPKSGAMAEALSEDDTTGDARVELVDVTTGEVTPAAFEPKPEPARIASRRFDNPDEESQIGREPGEEDAE